MTAFSQVPLYGLRPRPGLPNAQTYQPCTAREGGGMMPAGSSSNWPTASQSSRMVIGRMTNCSSRAGAQAARDAAPGATRTPGAAPCRALSTISPPSPRPGALLDELLEHVAGLVARLHLHPVAADADDLELLALLHLAELGRLGGRLLTQVGV